MAILQPLTSLDQKIIAIQIKYYMTLIKIYPKCSIKSMVDEFIEHKIEKQ
jgi:hypothetical protein